MSLYSISLFLHIVGALALFAALSVEWVGVAGARSASTAGQAHQWITLLGATRRIGGPASLTILITGIHMGVTHWGGAPWIVVGLGTMLGLAVLGPALGGRRLGAIARDISLAEGPIAPLLGARLQDPVLALSIYLRTALFLAIVFLMSNKPGLAGALTAVGVAVVLGLAAALPAWNRARGPGPVPRTPWAGQS